VVLIEDAEDLSLRGFFAGFRVWVDKLIVLLSLARCMLLLYIRN